MHKFATANAKSRAREQRAARPSTSDEIRDSAFGIDGGTLSAVRQGLEMVLPEPTPYTAPRRDKSVHQIKSITLERPDTRKAQSLESDALHFLIRTPNAPV